MSDHPPEYLRPEGFGADELVQALGTGASLRRTPPVTVRRVPCDTFDGRLYRRGEVLEAVGSAGASELVWRRHGGGALRHLNAPQPRFAWDLPPGPFRRQLEKVIEIRALLPLARIETRSEALEILDGEGKVVCRVFAEEHRAGAAGGGGPLRPLPARVRVEPMRGYSRAAERVREALGRVPSLQPEGRDVIEEALAAQGLGPPAAPAKTRVTLEPGMTAADAVRRLLLVLLEILEANEEGTRADLDSEFLHNFRVAVRRTRSALGQLKEVFPPAALEKFRTGFGWLGALTGPTRDLDVHLLEFPEYRAALPAAARADLEPLRIFLEARQRTEQRALARALGARRYRGLVRAWRNLLEADSGKWTRDPGAPDAGRPVRDVAGARLGKALRRALRDGRAIGDASPPGALHELRKTCKKLRYLLEFFQSLYPAREAGALIGALKGLQDNLGQYQDVHVQSEALGRFAREMEAQRGVGAGTHVAVGMLLEQLRGREAHLRREFAERFGAFAADPAVRRFEALLRAPGEASDDPPAHPSPLPSTGSEERP